jgi:hypothetical protein
MLHMDPVLAASSIRPLWPRDKRWTKFGRQKRVKSNARYRSDLERDIQCPGSSSGLYRTVYRALNVPIELPRRLDSEDIIDRLRGSRQADLVV